ncbi:hypothetical protein CgunFtcFv8_006266 [Champsocephalus gunnari]|uniref:Uncharacterized protein n=1 Tax=Champsocephalus gunnari TaxID=52237 RepID=A0AAN8BWY2_CHAGU|nr:hypothetical protein CgunFtcFv8_006266 [Champsocephalus gunnari]
MSAIGAVQEVHFLLAVVAPPGRPGRSRSVEHDGPGILVCHLSHVTQDIFFCDNTKKPSAERDKGKEEEV